MTLNGYIRLKRHKSLVLNRVLELKNKIFIDAIEGNVISEVDRTLFLKYNSRLIKLSKYSF